MAEIILFFGSLPGAAYFFGFDGFLKQAEEYRDAVTRELLWQRFSPVQVHGAPQFQKPATCRSQCLFYTTRALRKRYSAV